MAEIDRWHPEEDVPTQAKRLAPEELMDEIVRSNNHITQLGVEVTFTAAVHAATRFGHRYEDRRYPDDSSITPGRFRITPMTLFMSYLHNQPGLRNLDTDGFEQLAGEIGFMAMVFEELLERRSGLAFPEILRRHSPK
jgi:hypothetical protein